MSLDDKHRFLFMALTSAMENGGKPDWKSLAAELNCTANAAHLRYFRMKTQLEKEKAGAAGTDGGEGDADGEETPKKQTKPKSKGTPKNKKRKLAEETATKENSAAETNVKSEDYEVV